MLLAVEVIFVIASREAAWQSPYLRGDHFIDWPISTEAEQSLPPL